MNVLHYAEHVQDIFDTVDEMPRDYVLYKQDVSHLYTTYDLGCEPPFDALTLRSGYAFAYYAVAGSSHDSDLPYVETYIGTHWPASNEWHDDHCIDLMANRGVKVTQLDGLLANEVVAACRTYLEKSNVSA